eukprot:CAMPEP_0201512864 /NCGR_PEP_ID=MMETSP0161_2-20130828/5036_1 /ASSEMBLY_ACC=CAM_ASM_000251 /TAXON_ID=180227 /ORGANISM="Neoparamoeba aestuarina, Strain SoJaBio B1-5/56/2" /LENGTH=83 /DNA_ID=CAMNT_0047908867 /DNA_START=136 /DNA_END=383 /DNA_ORIENTATION=+
MPNCPECLGPISAGSFKASNGQEYHPKCFNCKKCGSSIGRSHKYTFIGKKMYHPDCVDKDPSLYQLQRSQAKKQQSSKAGGGG